MLRFIQFDLHVFTWEQFEAHAGIDATMSLFERLPHGCERIRPRRLRASDFRNFHAYRSDAEVARYQYWAPMSEAEANYKQACTQHVHVIERGRSIA